VSILDTDKSFEVKQGEVLYDSLSDQGYELPHGCLSGSCGACRVEIINGKEHLSLPTFVEKNTIDALKEEFRQNHGDSFVECKEIRLSCRAKVVGDIDIKPIK
jgi:ferredoxin